MTRSVHPAIVLVFLAAIAVPAAAQEWSEDFNGGIPSNWIIEDYLSWPGSWFNWETNDYWSEDNYSSGDGTLAAHADSDKSGTGDYDIGLVTPEFVVPNEAVLEYDANFQKIDFDRADVDISTNDGPWITLLSWNENYGGFRSLPGEHVRVDLSAYAGEIARIRFHYYNPGGDWDFYWQIDNVSVIECGSYIPCDSNCDEAIDGFDIDAFVMALTNQALYESTYPECSYLCNNDINDDGAVDGFDIDLFVACLMDG